MDEKDYGYFGSGLEGYMHYEQTVKDTKDILNEPTQSSNDKNKKNNDNNEYVYNEDALQPGSPEAWCLVWIFMLAISFIINVTVGKIFGGDIVNLNDQSIAGWKNWLGDDLGRFTSFVITVVPLAGFVINYFKARMR